MASKEIIRFETDIRKAEVFDVLTIYSFFATFIAHCQTKLGTHSITHILDSLVKQKRSHIAHFLTMLYSGQIRTIFGRCKRDLKRTRKSWLSLKKLEDSKDGKLFSLCNNVLFYELRLKLMTADGKQEAVDDFVVCTWFQVQRYENDQCEESKTLLKTMLTAIPDRFDISLAEIVYYSKMATIAEFENDIESAKDFASKAKYLSEIYEDKAAKILAHYSYLFLHRRLYLRDKSETNKQMVQEQCNIGCDMFPAPDKEDDFEMYCALIFLLVKACDFLGITYKFYVLYFDKVSTSDIEAAEEVLKSAYRYIPISTPRKELTFKFCMGRLYHLKSEFEKASIYLKETKELMKDGALNEKEQDNIQMYCKVFEFEEHSRSIFLAQDNETAKGMGFTRHSDVLNSDKVSPSDIEATEEVLTSEYRYIPIFTPRKKELMLSSLMGMLYLLKSKFEKAGICDKGTKELMKYGALGEKEQDNIYRYGEQFEEHRWHICLAQDNETANETGKVILEEQKYYVSQEILHVMLKKFGRKNDLTSRLCLDICKYIKGQNDKIVHAFPSYTIHSDREVIFVTIVKDLLSKKEEDEIGYSIKQRLVNQFSQEGEVVMSIITASEDSLTIDETKRLKDCINTHATNLMRRHKYLSIITASTVRSIGYGTHGHMIQKKPCIVLYVLMKGYIPLDEDPFETDYEGIPVDVREGVFETYPGGNVPKASEYHEPLRMGCCIGGEATNSKGVKLRGTLGGFIEHPHYGICGLTCAHVLLNSETFKQLKMNGGRKHWPDFYQSGAVYQPGDSKHQIGQLVQVVYQEGDNNHVGVEVALFQIEQRSPVEGKFPSSLNEANEELQFNSGKTYGLSRINSWPVVKFGRSTDKTSGKFTSNQALTSVKTVTHEWDHGVCKITLHNQLEIESVSSDNKFADYGDSGSLVFMNDEAGEHVCVGMVEGGFHPHGPTIVTPITPILEQFNVSKLKNFNENVFERDVRNALQFIIGELNAIKAGRANS